MKAVLERLSGTAGQYPHRVALADERVTLSYRQLREEIEQTAARLPFRRVGLLLDNGCAWAVLDLALLQRQATCVPLPSFFSDAQLRHTVADAGVEVIITDRPLRAAHLWPGTLPTEINAAGTRLACCVVEQAQPPALPPETAKITYTSGTTGKPQGVCLGGDALQQVILSLNVATAAGTDDSSLTLLPLSTLLANIAGLYVPLYSGGTAFVPSLAACGIECAGGLDAKRLIATLQRHMPTVTVVVPQLLAALVDAVAHGATLPASLRFIAVGGAPVAALLLHRARSLKLPVYQGYGLSEAASVVSVNTAAEDRITSVGRPLPHARVRIAADGEIMVAGSLFSAYLGRPSSHKGEWATGDTGFFDRDGYLYVTGRKKTAFATADGRNVSPEWVESELTGAPVIAQAALFGEGRDTNLAVLVARNGAAGPLIAAAVETVNRTLPRYARIGHWLIADEPFALHNGLANAAGEPDRAAIAARYRDDIERCYEGESCLALL